MLPLTLLQVVILSVKRGACVAGVQAASAFEDLAFEEYYEVYFIASDIEGAPLQGLEA